MRADLFSEDQTSIGLEALIKVDSEVGAHDWRFEAEVLFLLSSLHL